MKFRLVCEERAKWKENKQRGFVKKKKGEPTPAVTGGVEEKKKKESRRG